MESPASYEDPAWRILPSGHQFADDEAVMRYAIEIAGRGEGFVEPNPMVGAVIVDRDRRLVSCGYHQKFGQAHAEVNAIAAATGCCRNAVLFVTLEPCSHHGKTPPCADAVIAEGFSRVVVGCQDPAPHVAGRGLAKIREAGIDVVVGVCEPESQRLIAPFRMLYSQHRPWVHAKWAMTLDGRIAAASGHSKWISSEESRTRVHRLRGRMDAIITGAGTVRADNPELTARPPGPRQPIRVILDSSGNNVRIDSQLVRTLDKAPVLVCVRQDACVSTDMSAGFRSLVDAGVEVLPLPAAQADHDSDSSALRGLSLEALLAELGRRGCTNVLIEAGSRVLGSFFDRGLIDEVHAFVAPKLVGGQNAPGALGGRGLSQIPQQPDLTNVIWQISGCDIYCRGDVSRNEQSS